MVYIKRLITINKFLCICVSCKVHMPILARIKPKVTSRLCVFLYSLSIAKSIVSVVFLDYLRFSWQCKPFEGSLGFGAVAVDGKMEKSFSLFVRGATQTQNTTKDRFHILSHLSIFFPPCSCKLCGRQLSNLSNSRLQRGRKHTAEQTASRQRGNEHCS